MNICGEGVESGRRTADKAGSVVWRHQETSALAIRAAGRIRKETDAISARRAGRKKYEANAHVIRVTVQERKKLAQLRRARAREESTRRTRCETSSGAMKYRAERGRSGSHGVKNIRSGRGYDADFGLMERRHGEEDSRTRSRNCRCHRVAGNEKQAMR